MSDIEELTENYFEDILDEQEEQNLTASTTFLQLTPASSSAKSDTRSKLSAVSQVDHNEMIKTIHGRSYLNRVTEELSQCKAVVDRAEAEYRKCCETITLLESEREHVRAVMDEKPANKALNDRQKRRLNRIVYEMDLEHQLALRLKETLEITQHQLNKAEVEFATLGDLKMDVEARESKLNSAKARGASSRDNKELLYAKNALQQRQHKDIQQETAKALVEVKKRALETEALASYEKFRPFHDQTLDFLEREKTTALEEKHERREKKIGSLQRLKSDITTTRQTIGAMTRTKEANRLEKERNLAAYKEHLKSIGMNPEPHLLLLNQVAKLRKIGKEAKKRRRQNETVVTQTLLNEWEDEKRKRKLYPTLYEKSDRHRYIPPSETEYVLPSILHEEPEPSKTAEDGRLSLQDESRFQNSSSEGEGISSELESESEEGVVVLETNVLPSRAKTRQKRAATTTGDPAASQLIAATAPEFEGLWADSGKSSRPYTEGVQRAPAALKTKAEQQQFSKTMAQLRKNTVRPQVAAGRRFENKAGYSATPTSVRFNDFDVGNSYTINVVLTNVSYSINFVKVLDITESLKDFIKLTFNPPGQMSAGMRCNLGVHFKPLINENLNGVINLLTMTGPMEIPIEIRIKKCDFKLTTEKIDFGSSVIGETLTKTLALKNNGKLGSKFTVQKINNKTDIGLDDAISLKMIEPVEEIGPCGSIDFELKWQPSVPGSWAAKYTFAFEDSESPDLNLDVKALALDVPIWLSETVKDMKICMFDRLYQDAIVINNRASTALRITFQIDDALIPFVDVLPKTAYAQAGSVFKAQLRLSPKVNMLKDEKLEKYIDKSVGMMEFNVTILVADQKRPVVLNVIAVLTSSELEFRFPQEDSTVLDMGNCTTVETVWQEIELFNHSLLPQEYGFCGLPDYIEVQPNDGFGTIMPKETIKLEVCFSAPRADVFETTLMCKTLVGRQFLLPIRGVGVLPPLTLSETAISFAATALYDERSVEVTLRNSHEDANQFTHPVPRVGRGVVVPVGVTGFEFLVDEEIPIQIHPRTGELAPGEKDRIWIQFKPKIPDKLIQQEGLIKWKEITQQKIDAQYKEDFLKERNRLKAEAESGKNTKKTKKDEKPDLEPKLVKPQLPQGPSVEEITPDTDTYQQARNSLLRKYIGQVTQYIIPCVIKTPSKVEREYTLYLDIRCPAIKPDLMIISDDGRHCLDYGDVLIGRTAQRILSIQNIGNAVTNLNTSVLDPNGPFELRNPVRPIDPGETCDLQLNFVPKANETYQQHFEVKSKWNSVHVILKARGVHPNVRIDESAIDVGGVIIGEYSETRLAIINESSLKVEFDIGLGHYSDTDGMGIRGLKGPQKEVSFVQENSPIPAMGSNLNGTSVFSVSPVKGSILPKSSTNVTLSFAPDHDREYKDELRIRLFEKLIVQKIPLCGLGRRHLMYISGFDPTSPKHRSLMEVKVKIEEQKDSKDKDKDKDKNVDKTETGIEPPAEVLSVSIPVALDMDTGLYSGSRGLCIHCIRSVLPSQKKSGDFAWEINGAVSSKGFKFEPERGNVEAGEKKAIVVKWVSSPEMDLSQPIVSSNINMTLKSDVTEQIPIVLSALIVN